VYPTTTGPGTSRTDATRACFCAHARDLEPTGFRRRDNVSQQGGLPVCFFLRIAPRPRGRAGYEGNRVKGESRAQNRVAVCADCLAKNRTARAGVVFIDFLNPPSITRETPLHQSADRKRTAVDRDLLRPQILEFKVSRVERKYILL
jgi:hypothetical protein